MKVSSLWQKNKHSGEQKVTLCCIKICNWGDSLKILATMSKHRTPRQDLNVCNAEVLCYVNYFILVGIKILKDSYTYFTLERETSRGNSNKLGAYWDIGFVLKCIVLQTLLFLPQHQHLAL